MSYELRDYQRKSVDDCIRSLMSRPILVAPTGSGKTVMAVEIINRVGGKALWVTHREELMEQAEKHLSRYGFTCTRIKTGYEYDPRATAVVASVQTLVNRKIPSGVNIAVIDECHHAPSESYKKVFESGLPILGLTATPFRLDGIGLGGAMGFGKIIESASISELIKTGFLIKPKVYAVEKPDTTMVSTCLGDYNHAELELVTNTPYLVGKIVETWKAKANGRRTICYACSVAHSRRIAEEFQKNKIPCEHIDGNTPPDIRAGTIENLRVGKICVLTNCQILTEGFDLPSVECLIIARPTQSLCLHLQMLGRIMRPLANKTATVLDHAGNHHRHGAVDRPLEYSLDFKVRTAICGEPLGLRQCKKCFLLYPIIETVCPGCGYETPKRKDIRVQDGDLVEFDDCPFRYREDFWKLIRFKPEADELYFRRFGENPVILDGMLVDIKTADKKIKKRLYTTWATDRDSDFAHIKYKKVFNTSPWWETYEFRNWEERIKQ